MFTSIISHNYKRVLQGSSEIRINAHSWLGVLLCGEVVVGGGCGGFLNNASCQWSNRDKINLPAGTLRPFSDYFHICILVIA